MPKPADFDESVSDGTDLLDENELTTLQPNIPFMEGFQEPPEDASEARTKLIPDNDSDEPTETTGEEETESDEGEEPGGEPEKGEGEGDAGDSQRSLIDWVAKNRPQFRGIAQKYGDNHQFMDGLLNAATRISQRDEDAELGRIVRDRKQEVLEYLGGVKRAEPAGNGQPPAPPGPEIPGPEQLARWQAAVEANPANPPREAVEGLRKAGHDALRFFHRLQTPEGVRELLAPILGEHSQQIQQSFQQQAAQQAASYQDSAALSNLVSQNKDWLFEGGNVQSGVYTPLGERFNGYFSQMFQAGLPGSAAFQVAKWRLDSDQFAAQHQAAGTQPAGAGARRKPQVASPTPQRRSQKEEDALVAKESVRDTLLRKLREQEGKR